MDLRQYVMTEGQRTDAALASGKIDEAVRISGEAAATADAEWTRLYNAHDSGSDEALVAANFIAGRHLVALLNTGEAVEAYSMAAMLLYRSTLARAVTISLRQSLLDILCSMLDAALVLGDQPGFMSGDNEDGTADHYAYIVSYISSMLYAMYQAVGESRPDTAMLEDAYARLEQMNEIGAVQSPNVSIGDKEVEADNISLILPDLLGRSKALGMINVEGE